MEIFLQLLETAVFFLFLFLIGLSDAYMRKVPNRYLLGLIFLWTAHMLSLKIRSSLFDTLNWRVVIVRILSAAVIATSVLFVQFLFQVITKRKGIGAGDIKLFFVITLYLGFEKGLYVLFLSCILAVINNVWRIASENLSGQTAKRHKLREENSSFPFGPSIVCSAVMVMLISVVVATL